MSGVAEAIFDKFGHISIVIKDRSKFKGWYLKLEMYA